VGGGTNEVVGTPIAIGTITVNGTTYTKYKLVVDCGALPNNTQKNVPITLPSTRNILSVYGASTNPTLGMVYPIPFYNAADASYSITAIVTSSGGDAIKLITKTDLSDWADTKITIEYY